MIFNSYLPVFLKTNNSIFHGRLGARLTRLMTVSSLLFAPLFAAGENSAFEDQAAQGDSHRVVIEQLLDGLHRAAAESDAADYFARYTQNAHFLGTDASERWSMDAFKAYAEKPFAEGRGWRYDVVTRHLVPTASSAVYGFDELLSNEKLGLCRGSGVVVFDGERWQVAHYVLSMLIPNSIAESVGRESAQALEQADP
ncbi:MAG: nuclear transport factor 2 family protein [Pseudomonadales bacterium]|jgi:hypothetical protein